MDSVRQAAADLVGRQCGKTYDWKTECIICAGGLSGVLNVLLATLEPGDEVLMTDPTYVGLINRVRLAGGVPRFVPLLPTTEGWRRMWIYRALGNYPSAGKTTAISVNGTAARSALRCTRLACRFTWANSAASSIFSMVSPSLRESRVASPTQV
jgi:hypothetical protein